MLPASESARTAEQQAYGAAQPQQELLLPEMLQVLRRRAWVIGGCALLGLLLAISYVVLRAPRYEAAAKIEVTPAHRNRLGLDELEATALSSNESNYRL